MLVTAISHSHPNCHPRTTGLASTQVGNPCSLFPFYFYLPKCHWSCGSANFGAPLLNVPPSLCKSNSGSLALHPTLDQLPRSCFYLWTSLYSEAHLVLSPLPQGPCSASHSSQHTENNPCYLSLFHGKSNWWHLWCPSFLSARASAQTCACVGERINLFNFSTVSQSRASNGKKIPLAYLLRTLEQGKLPLPILFSGLGHWLSRNIQRD